jgi:exopolysaccharide biosynthesis polyprenyl glycosylphosphotransferase
VVAAISPDGETSTAPPMLSALPRTRRTFRSQRERWLTRYARNVLISDLVVVCGAVYLAQASRFDQIGNTVGRDFDPNLGWYYTFVSLTLAALWLVSLGLVNSRSPQVLGRGMGEYRRVVWATFLLFGAASIAAILLGLNLFARGYLAVACPLGLIGLLATRFMWHGFDRRMRSNGTLKTRVLVAGTTQGAADIAAKFTAQRERGFEVVGLCTPEGPDTDGDSIEIMGTKVPIVQADNAIVNAVKITGADTVVLSATNHLSSDAVRRLVWDLECLGVEMIVSAGHFDAVDSRLSSQTMGGMAVVHVGKPQYDRANSWGKRAYDIFFSSLALIVASPMLIGAAVAVKLSSRGPIFYYAERIGMDGKTFKMIKFRSMYEGSDAKIAEMMDNSGKELLYFKVKDDPRITPVGKWLRKFSIDEMPQFINVLKGEMSIVGPRPQVAREVEAYDDLIGTRLFVRPGVTGLWQVSGRNDLSIEDSKRLDMSYVENWSMGLDIQICFRTAQVVLTGRGAY